MSRQRNGFHDTTVADWQPERARPEVKLPVIEPPIRTGMTPAQRMELQAIAERVNTTYSGFARKLRAMDELVAWVEAYKATVA